MIGYRRFAVVAAGSLALGFAGAQAWGGPATTVMPELVQTVTTGPQALLPSPAASPR